MSVTSKTGLIPSQRKIHRFFRSKKVSTHSLSTGTVAKPVEFSLRPFGGLYNPYAKGCSVLCNHPAPTAVRTIIRRVKDTWSSEGKSYWQDCVSQQQKDKYGQVHDDLSGGQIPEDLFRRYTDTDSRPMTPSPTTASVRTKTSAGSFLNARRCVTPEPGKDAMIKRKKIILDLRRSHSQETLYWRASSEVSQGVTLDTIPSSIYQQSKTTKGTKPTEDHATKKVTSEDQPLEEVKPPPGCINERDTDEAALQRRGKRRKKSKSQPLVATFYISQDPETQIAAMGPDSLSASTRPSLVPNTTVKLPNTDGDSNCIPTQLKDSFLTEEAFRVLKTELDIDVIENTFERYLNRALREAIKFLPHKKSKPLNRENELDEAPPLPFDCSKIPRKFSKSASRFEVPIDLMTLEKLSVFSYLSKYVWVSRQRKQLYKRIFIKYIKEEVGELENNENSERIKDQSIPAEPIKERIISSVNFRKALEEVLGFYGTKEIVDGVCGLVKIEIREEINFRTWCGIVAFAERFALTEPTETDSCDELEKADFDTLEQRLEDLTLSDELRVVLTKIREGHCVE